MAYEKKCGPEDLVVSANYQINGDRAGQTDFKCGDTSVTLHRDGTVTSLQVNGIQGGYKGYTELCALIEGIIEWREK